MSSQRERFGNPNWKPIDEAALSQGRALQHYERVITRIFVRLAATGLVHKGGRRYHELVDECRQIASREAHRIYEAKHPPRVTR